METQKHGHLLALAIFVALLGGCAVAPPSSEVGATGYLDGKADGPTACNAEEMALISCAAANCVEDDSEECVNMQCADVVTELSSSCGACIEESYGDLEIAATVCGTAAAPAGPCGEETELVDCAVLACEGLAGDPLLECLEGNCDTEDITAACGECIATQGLAGTEALAACAYAPSDAACTSAETESLATCEATHCDGLEGDAFGECFTTRCGDELLAATRSCFICLGQSLDDGESFDGAMSFCGGAGDEPEPEPADAPTVCEESEIGAVVACADTHCAGTAGDELNECMEMHCVDALEAAELSDPCATCFIYNIEAGGGMDAVRSECL